MRNRILALTIFLILCATCFLAIINPTKANPFPTNPIITIVSPSQQTYNTNSINLDIKISTQYDGYYFNSSEKRITYILDNKEAMSLDHTNYSYDQDTKTSTVEASTILSELSQGDHSLTVYVEYDYDVQVIESNSSINFSINSSNSFPILELTSISVAITLIMGIFLFSKKNKRREK